MLYAFDCMKGISLKNSKLDPLQFISLRNVSSSRDIQILVFKNQLSVETVLYSDDEGYEGKRVELWNSVKIWFDAHTPHRTKKKLLAVDEACMAIYILTSKGTSFVSSGSSRKGTVICFEYPTAGAFFIKTECYRFCPLSHCGSLFCQNRMLYVRLMSLFCQCERFLCPL